MHANRRVAKVARQRGRKQTFCSYLGALLWRLAFLPAVPTSLPFTCLLCLSILMPGIVTGAADTKLQFFGIYCVPSPLSDAGTINLTSGSFQWGRREEKRETLLSSLRFTWSSTFLPGPHYMPFQLFINLPPPFAFSSPSGTSF